VQDGDAAHVVVTPAPGIDESSPSEQRPRVEAVVDLDDDTVRFVGASGPRDESADAVTLNASAMEVAESITVENATGDAFVVQTFDGEVLDGDGVAVETVLVNETGSGDGVVVESVTGNETDDTDE
jgi:hypothetical protein